MDAFIQFFENIENERIRNLALETHAHIILTLPEIKPAYKYRTPFYVHNKNILFLNPQKDHIVMGFINGNLMTPNLKLVANDRKHVRHYLVYSVNDLTDPIVDLLLLEAFEIDKQMKT